MKIALVIPAAGSGERLGLGVPKALVPVAGLPLLRRTLDRLAEAASWAETVVLAPPGSLEDFRRAVAGAPPRLGIVRVLEGGATRQQSVAAGVAAIGETIDLVCVHDAARPLVTAGTVAGALEEAMVHGAATVASRPSDSVREDLGGGGSRALDRASLWLVETPQVFRRELLAKAHRAAAASGETYTDDAALVEAIGHDIRIVASESRNLKVTFRSDLALVEEMLGRG